MKDSNLLQNDEEGTVYSSAAEPILYPADKWNIRPRLVEVGGSVQEYDPNLYRVLQMLYLIWNEDEELLNYADCASSYKRLVSYDNWVVPLEDALDSVDWEFRGFCDKLFRETFRSFQKEPQKLVAGNVDRFIEEVLLLKLVYIQRRLWEYRRYRTRLHGKSRLLVPFSLYLRALKEIVSGALSRLASFLCFPEGLKFVFQNTAGGHSRLTSLFYLIHPKRIFQTIAFKRPAEGLDKCRKNITVVNGGILRAALERPYYERNRMVESISSSEHPLPESADSEFQCEQVQRDLEEMSIWETERSKVYLDWTAKLSALLTSNPELDPLFSPKAAIHCLVSVAEKYAKQLAEIHVRRRRYAQQVLESTNVQLRSIMFLKSRKSEFTKWISNRFGFSKLVRNVMSLTKYNNRRKLKYGDGSTLTLEQVECLIYDSKIVQVLKDCFVDHWERLPGSTADESLGRNSLVKIEKSTLDTQVVWVYYTQNLLIEENIDFGPRMCYEKRARLLLAKGFEKEKSAPIQMQMKADIDKADIILIEHDKELCVDSTRKSTRTSTNMRVTRSEGSPLRKRKCDASPSIDRGRLNPDSSVSSSSFVGSAPCDGDDHDAPRKKARTDVAVESRNDKSGDAGCRSTKLPSSRIPSLIPKPLLSPYLLPSWHAANGKLSEPSSFSMPANPCIDSIASLSPPAISPIPATKTPLFDADRIELVKDRIKKLISLSDINYMRSEMAQVSSDSRSGLVKRRDDEISGAPPLCSSNSVNPTFDSISTAPPLIDLTGDGGDSNGPSLSGNCDPASLESSQSFAKGSNFGLADSGFTHQQPTFVSSNNSDNFRTFDPSLRFSSQQSNRDLEMNSGNPNLGHPPPISDSCLLHFHNHNIHPSSGIDLHFKGSNNQFFGCEPAQGRVITQPPICTIGFYEAAPPASLPFVPFDVMNQIGTNQMTSGEQTSLTSSPWNPVMGLSNNFVGANFMQPQGYGYQNRTHFQQNNFYGNPSLNGGGASLSGALLPNFYLNSSTPRPPSEFGNFGMNPVGIGMNVRAVQPQSAAFGLGPPSNNYGPWFATE